MEQTRDELFSKVDKLFDLDFSNRAIGDIEETSDGWVDTIVFDGSISIKDKCDLVQFIDSIFNNYHQDDSSSNFIETNIYTKDIITKELLELTITPDTAHDVKMLLLNTITTKELKMAFSLNTVNDFVTDDELPIFKGEITLVLK